MLKKTHLLLCLLITVFFCFGQDTATVDEFEKFAGDAVSTTFSTASVSTHKKSASVDIYWMSSVLLCTLIAGILVRFKSTRQLRSLFLILSIITFGFYRGGCPCSIQSFQNNILLLSGNSVRWPSILLFAGLLPVTYLFGRVYCGWICHLGALQEFVFKTSSFKLFQSERSQEIMRNIRTAVLVILISQLLITRTNLYRQVDPFAVIYTFYSDYFVGWILVFMVIASSFVLYRPFCKTVCPVGLILGWVSKIPGASVLGVRSNCISCIQCSRKCSINAITHDNKISVIDNQECIRCGECMTGCKKDSLVFRRKGKQHFTRIECKPLL
jgi:polyferredoxin